MTTKDVLALGTDVKPHVLFEGEYEQWKDRFLDFVDRQKNGENIRISLETGPMPRIIWTVPAVPANNVPEHEEIKPIKKYTEEEKDRYDADRLARSFLIMATHK